MAPGAGSGSAKQASISANIDMTCSAEQRWLWVGGLSQASSNEALQTEFSSFGPVERAFVAPSGHGSASHRHGFVLFADKSDAQAALSKLREDKSALSSSLADVRVDWARPEVSQKPVKSRSPKRPSSSKPHVPPGFVCICSQKSVQLDQQSHFTRDTHDQLLHDEMEAEKYKEQGANVQTMYLPGGGLMAVNPSKNLCIGARAHRMAVFMGKLTNYTELVEKHQVSQPKPSEKGKARLLNVPELLCILYSKLGLNMLPELQGKFAFCMYDPKLLRVLAVRDAEGTYPVVQALTTHDNLVIVCGPYFPEGHREPTQLQPSEYKYGWHAPPLHYDAAVAPPAEAGASDEAPAGQSAAKKRKNRRTRKPRSNNGGGEAAEETSEQTQHLVEEEDASQSTSATADAAAPAAGARKVRRRRPRRKATSMDDNTIVLPETLDECGFVVDQDVQEQPTPGQDQPAQEQPSASGEVQQQSDSALAARTSRNRRRQRDTRNRRASLDNNQPNATHPGGSDEAAATAAANHVDSAPGSSNLANGLNQAGAIPNSSNAKGWKRGGHKRGGGGSKASSSEQASSNQAGPSQAAVPPAAGPSDPNGVSQESMAGAGPKKKQNNRRTRGNGGGSRRGSIDLPAGGDGTGTVAAGDSLAAAATSSTPAAEATANGEHNGKPPASGGSGRRRSNASRRRASLDLPQDGSQGERKPGRGRRASLDQGGRRPAGTDQVWVPKGSLGSASGSGTAGGSAVDLGLASHKISVGQDLDNLGTMLAAGLKGASPRAAGKVLVDAVAAVKPSRSCGELKTLPSGGSGQTAPPGLVC